MHDKTFADVFQGNYLADWAKIGQFRKPLIAAVNGYAVKNVGISDRSQSLFSARRRL
jgi:hypothetical protein